MAKRYLLILLILPSLFFYACSGDDTSDKENQAAAGSEGQGGQLVYTAPENWVKEKPATSMRKAQFRLPGQDGAEDAVLAIFYFPRGGGSVEANIQRWYGQFKQPDGSRTAELAEEKKITVNDLAVTMVYATGTFMKSKSPMMMGGPKEAMEDYAMLAAVVETEKAPWFVKATGPKQTIDHWRPSFNKFVQSFHF